MTQPLNVPEMIGSDTEPGVTHVRMIEVSTLSGSASVHGSSTKLGNETDSSLLLGLRDWADAVVVGARTVKAEGYGPMGASESRDRPATLVIMSYSLNLNPGLPVFSGSGEVLIASPHEAIAANESAVRTLHDAGLTLVDTGRGTARELLEALAERGLHKISLEGGPGIFAKFIAEDVIDEFYLTLDPRLTSRVDTPLVSASHVRSDTPSAPDRVAADGLTMKLAAVAADSDSTVFLRYRRQQTP